MTEKQDKVRANPEASPKRKNPESVIVKGVVARGTQESGARLREAIEQPLSRRVFQNLLQQLDSYMIYSGAPEWKK